MNRVTEAELQHAIDAYDEIITRAADVTHFITGEVRREAFRAALTAAALAREKAAANGLELLTGLLVTVVDVGWPLTKSETEAMRLTAAAAGQILRVLDQPAVVAPMPIYGATEPDQGEDILGLREGKE